jgi:PKD repeat protein
MKCSWERLFLSALMVFAIVSVLCVGCAKEATKIGAKFSASPRSGTAPLEVQFADQSTGDVTQWEWDFDSDGTVDSTQQNPSYTYEAVGKYTVSLTVTGSEGSDTEIKANYIEVKEKEAAVITIGVLNDLTGYASGALRPYQWAMEDLVDYVNKEDPIPGVELRLVTYDTQFDPARDIPGYEYVRDQGAEVVYAVTSTSGESLQAYAAIDHIPVVCGSTTAALIEPNGWTSCLAPPYKDSAKSLLDWIHEQWPDYPTKPKLYSVGWQFAGGIDMEEGAAEYCQDNPDAFDYVGKTMASFGTATWAGAVEAAKDCDYVYLCMFGSGAISFINEYRAKGYDGTIIGLYNVPAYQGLMEESCGKQALDGMLIAFTPGWWTDGQPISARAKEMLYRYHPDDAEGEIASGNSYHSAVVHFSLVIEIIRKAVEQVGADNFDGQAFYNALDGFETTLGGTRTYAYPDGRRYALQDTAIWEYSADAGDYIRVSDYLPIVGD